MFVFCIQHQLSVFIFYSSSFSYSGMHYIGLSSFASPSLPPSTFPFTRLLFNDPHTSLFLLHPITYLSLEAKPTDKSPHLVATSEQQSMKTLQDFGGKSHCLSLLLTTIAISPPLPLFLVGGSYFTRSTYNSHGQSNLALTQLNLF